MESRSPSVVVVPRPEFLGVAKSHSPLSVECIHLMSFLLGSCFSYWLQIGSTEKELSRPSSVRYGGKTKIYDFLSPTDPLSVMLSHLTKTTLADLFAYLLPGDVTPEINKLPRNSRIFSCLRATTLLRK